VVRSSAASDVYKRQSLVWFVRRAKLGATR
jgi:hypothetical protein